MEEVLGFLEADGNLVECRYGEHMSYAFNLAKKIRKIKRKNEHHDDEELLKLNMIVRIHRGWFAFPTKDGKEIMTRIQYDYIMKHYNGLEDYETAMYLLEMQLKADDIEIIDSDETPYDFSKPTKYPLERILVVREDFDDRGIEEPYADHWMAGNAYILQMYGFGKEYALLTGRNEVYEVNHDDIDHDMTKQFQDAMHKEIKENGHNFDTVGKLKNILEDLQMARANKQ